MLSRSRRISKTEFPAIVRTGRLYFSPRLQLRVLKLPISTEQSRFAFVVPAKAVKTAVERNLLKRRSRHVIYKHLGEIKNGFLCVFFLKKEMANLKFPLFENEFIMLLNQAKLTY